MEDLSTIAAPYGIPSKRLDGNDVLGVHSAAAEAIRRARFGQGPSFLEFVTHRWRGHVGPNYDLDVGIRDPGEVESWMARCPIRRLEATLTGLDGITPEKLKSVWAEAEAEVEDAVEFARASPQPKPESVLEHVYVGGA
jgi:TPP-dependent pyruvate/acetoin dehydrogenase alpha subunit